MKTLGKILANKIATILIIVLLLAGGLFAFRNSIKNMFAGTSNAEYEFVIKRFSKQTKLVVADAEIKTTRHQTFENDHLKDWPSWSKPLVKFFVGRDLVVDIPVKTEFKVDLNNISKDDITINHGVVTFSKFLTIEVDSQQDGDPTIQKTSNGAVDKIVDAATSGKEAQKFFSEKTKETVYKTSDYVLKKKKTKIIEATNAALSNILNLSSDKYLKVDLQENNINFKIVDKK